MNDNFISYTGVYPIYEYIDNLVETTSGSITITSNNLIEYSSNINAITSNNLIAYTSNNIVITSNDIMGYVNSVSAGLQTDINTRQKGLLNTTADRVVLTTTNGDITVSTITKEQLEGLTDKIQDLSDSIFEEPLEGLENIDMFQDAGQQGQVASLATAVGVLATQVNALSAATAAVAGTGVVGGVFNIVSDAIEGIDLAVKLNGKMDKGSAPVRMNIGETIYTPLFLAGNGYLQIALNDDFTFNGLESGNIRLSDTFKNSKQNTIDGKHTADRVLITDTQNKVKTANVKVEELNYLQDTNKNIHQHFIDTSNYVDFTSNNLIEYTNTTSNYLITHTNTTSNAIMTDVDIKFVYSSNYTDKTSNAIMTDVNSKFVYSSNYTDKTSNAIMIDIKSKNCGYIKLF
jgi:hypothetical protein